jgi:hypothetical protein
MSSHDTTDSRRRLAMQLAIQLPEGVAEARAVLAMTSEALEDFLIPATSDAHRRARLLGWGMTPAEAIERAPGAPAVMVREILLGFCSLLFTAPVGLLLLKFCGIGAGVTFMVGVTMVALVLGTVPALALATVTPLLHNLLLIPPALEFSQPTLAEAVAAGAYLVLAVMVPWIAARRTTIRAAVIPAEPGELAEIRARMTG